MATYRWTAPRCPPLARCPNQTFSPPRRGRGLKQSEQIISYMDSTWFVDIVGHRHVPTCSCRDKWRKEQDDVVYGGLARRPLSSSIGRPRPHGGDLCLQRLGTWCRPSCSTPERLPGPELGPFVLAKRVSASLSDAAHVQRPATRQGSLGAP